MDSRAWRAPRAAGRASPRARRRARRVVFKAAPRRVRQCRAEWLARAPPRCRRAAAAGGAWCVASRLALHTLPIAKAKGRMASQPGLLFLEGGDCSPGRPQAMASVAFSRPARRHCRVPLRNTAALPQCSWQRRLPLCPQQCDSEGKRSSEPANVALLLLLRSLFSPLFLLSFFSPSALTHPSAQRCRLSVSPFGGPV